MKERKEKQEEMALRLQREKELTNAVNWKIFTVQSILVGGGEDNVEITEKSLELGKKWLQPHHYDEVVKERANDGRCGFPCCKFTIPVPTR
jgi:hypothetical protein